MAWLVFMGWVISWANEWEDYSSSLGEGTEIPRNWATAHFWPFMVDLRTVMVLVRVPFSMLVYYNEHVMRLKVYWKSNLPPSWVWLVVTVFVVSYGCVIF